MENDDDLAKESELRFRQLVDSLPQSIVSVDRSGIFLFMNQLSASRLGGCPEDFVGKSMWNLFPREYAERQMQLIWQALDSGEMLEVISETVVDGKDCWYEVRIFPWKNLSGIFDKVILVLTDITERYLAEQEVHRLNAELERRVLERTQQLETANKELEAFTYSVSHDLRAPLRAINSYTRIILEDYSERFDAEGLRILEQVRTGVERMARMIDDLLSLSRVSRHEIQLQPVDLSEMARQIAQELQDLQPERQVTFEVLPGCACSGDAGLLRIALYNLLENAWKFSGCKEHALIRFGESLVGGKRCFFVQDNGVGFDTAYSSKLFGVFQRLHLAEEFPGTGVGLVTVKRIIQRHNGRIWVEAVKDQGATFYFTV